MARENAHQRLIRMTEHENALWAKGHRVAGIDEVGRGPLAGPVYAACVIIPQGALIEGVNDSKKLSEKSREALYERLLERAAYIGLGIVSEKEIDEINILNATKRAMNEAAKDAPEAFFLVDAMTGLDLPPDRTRSIVHGDAVSYMIAAASIIAKVCRDRYMKQLHEVYPQYGFDANKGYGTPQHMQALREHGFCPAHRRSFIRGLFP